MKLGLIVGSGREGSYNKKISRIIEKLGSDKNVEIDILDIESLPMYNEDIEKDSIKSVEILREKIRNSQGLIFVTPEHNYSIPAILKNAIDWMSRVDRVMIGKPGMIVGASTGFLGTVNAQNHLREILNSPGLEVTMMPGNKVYIAQVQDKFDSEENLIDETTKEFIDTGLNNFIKWIEKTK